VHNHYNKNKPKPTKITNSWISLIESISRKLYQDLATKLHIMPALIAIIVQKKQSNLSAKRAIGWSATSTFLTCNY